MPKDISIQTDESFLLIDLLKTAHKISKELGDKIIADHKGEHEINEETLQAWLNSRNVINMHHVCDAFYRGSLFYGEDSHIKEDISFLENVANISSIVGLDPVFYIQPGNKIARAPGFAYEINHPDPAAILKDVLFGRTRFECLGSINLTFYLTLLDLHLLIYGLDDGKKRFNALFTPDQTSEVAPYRRIQIGAAGIVFTPGEWERFSNIIFFNKVIPDINIEQLIDHPEKWIGIRLGIKGHPDYLNKHPGGVAQGWNVIFAGLNNNKEPMFLGAQKQGENYLFSYNELLKILSDEYNNLPAYSEKKYASTISSAHNMIGYYADLVTLDAQTIKMLIEKPNELQVMLNDFCMRHANVIKNKNYYSPIIKEDLPESFFSKPQIKETKDDNQVTFRFFKSERRNPNVTQDDLALLHRPRSH